MLSDTVVLKENHIQLVTNQFGDIPAADTSGFGLYFYDTRHLSTFEFRVNGQRPIYLSHSADRNYIATFQFVNPPFVLADGRRVARQTISIRRSRFVDERAFHERLGFYNCNQFPVDLEVTLSFDADFRDIFAVRGYASQQLAGRTSSYFGPDGLLFSYFGRDKVQRSTLIHAAPCNSATRSPAVGNVESGMDSTPDIRPELLSANVMLFRVHLEPHVPVSITLYVRPSIGRRYATRVPDFDRALERLARSYEDWHRECTTFATDNELFDQSLLRQSRFDIRTLLEFVELQPEAVVETSPHSDLKAESSAPLAGAAFCDQSQEMRDGSGSYREPLRTADRKKVRPRRYVVPSAGIPWYAVPFGRDAILTALQTLVYNPAIAEGTLRFLAHYQGRKCDSVTEEEPGKIFHELRRGELANLREIPHVPYYGTVDATPLFVVLFVETMAWLGDSAAGTRLYHDLLPHVLQALYWIDVYGDQDGDGYVEYMSRNKGGVVNQGWKDSADSLQYEHGQPALLPAALVEVQGYVYHAKMGLSQLLESRGDTAHAERLRSEAIALRERFNRDFWMGPPNGAEPFFAQALDRDKHQVRSITSNVGHCLWSGIVDEAKAASVVRRLMAADMFSGWGIRTLSSASPNYNPMSYHNGSVWPHDNSLIALGMRRYGYTEEAVTIISGIINAGFRFPSNRLPELFCGFARDRRFNSSPASYIVSCSPQAWAAAAPFLFLQTLLDIRPLDGGRRLWIEPAVNDLFHFYRVERLRVGDEHVSFDVHEQDGRVYIQRRAGNVTLCSRSAVIE
jgi:glycogen debranching enzyme